MPVKTLIKLLASILSGLICSLSVPLSIALIDLIARALSPQPSEGWGYFALLLLIAGIIPISMVCSGLLSLAMGSMPGLAKWDLVILPEISGSISAISGLALAGFSISGAVGIIMIIATYAQFSLIGIPIYLVLSGVSFKTKPLEA